MIWIKNSIFIFIIIIKLNCLSRENLSKSHIGYVMPDEKKLKISETLRKFHEKKSDGDDL